MTYSTTKEITALRNYKLNAIILFSYSENECLRNMILHVDCKGFWRRCITHRTTEFLIFPSSGILENRKPDVSETGSVSVLRWGWKAPTQLGPLERVNVNHWAMSVRFTTAIYSPETRLIRREIRRKYAIKTVIRARTGVEPSQQNQGQEHQCSLQGNQLSGCLPAITWERKQIQFPKRCVF
jgi:hypothetical protein